MGLERWQALLEKAREIMPPDREPSIFATAGRGYYENPTTDLLAFFLDPQQEHGLGECFLRGLLACLPEADELSVGLSQPPRREVQTHVGSRIDLMLVSDNWQLVLENKVYHTQNNPFNDYADYGSSQLREGQRLILAVLSPDGVCVNTNWVGISYTRLIDAVRQQLGQWMIAQPLDKWQVFARDFLLHLENITVEQGMDEQVSGFVFDNLPEIYRLIRLRDGALNALDEKIVAKLEAEVPAYERYTRRHTWEHGPALRYASNQWESWSDVVLYLDTGGDVLKPCIRVYVCDVDEVLGQQAKQLFEHTEPRPEQQGSILGFEWGLERYDEDEILQFITEKMQLLMELETQRQSEIAAETEGAI